MYFDESGNGPHATLILHGTPTPPESMLPLARHLSAGRRILAPHLPGYGRSAEVPVLTTGPLEAMLEQELVDRGVRSLDVIGFSGGAFRALSFACVTGLRVERVVAIGGFACFSPEEREGMRALASALRAGATFDDILAARLLSPATLASDPGLASSVNAWVRATTPANLAAELDDQADAPDLRLALGHLEAKVLARTGSDDVTTPPGHARQIAAAARHGVLQIVPDRPHALLIEDREPTFRAIEAFLGA